MASSSRVSKPKYDVFLSFRGEDTRHSIVSHLYEALASRGIVTFKDDKRLEIGDHISNELHRAIEGSNFVVVLLSENYATSRWCLMELQLIMELQMEGRLGVFPVFYNVKPSSVRHQLESFDLRRYQRPDEADKVLRWREALTLVANLSGVESRLFSDEATMVWKIVKDISRRNTLMHKVDFRNIVGVDAHMQGLMSLLDMDSKNDDVLMLGIWGMGGIGKTTIAKCLYARLSSQFTTSYFTDDIKGIHKNSDLLKNLQYKLLYNTLGDDIRPWCMEAGCEIIAERLGNLNVLLVLDGVDKVDQINALAKETRWFGSGSRIIITTRDRGLLNSCRVKIIYEVDCLDDKDSLQMFKQIAFEGNSPPSVDFEQLSIRATQLAHGLPSALQANALYLRGRANSLDEWEEAVCGLESSPDEDTMKILKMSFEGLTKPQQDAFLDVASLFNGYTFQSVASLLDGVRLETNHKLRVLAEKSLISITANEYVILHKFVEQMGREIMFDRKKFLGDPEKLQDALVHGAGTTTECISLHTCEMPCPVAMESGFINEMCNLKFLKVYKHIDSNKSRLQVIPEDNFHDMPFSLRLLHWDAFPLTTLLRIKPKNFLVELSLRHSNLETFGNGTLVFPELRKLDVTGCEKLSYLPLLLCSKNLDELCLQQCRRLKGIPQSIGKWSKISKLNLSYYGGPQSPIGVVIRKDHMMIVTLEFPTAKTEMQFNNITITGVLTFRLFTDLEGYVEYFSFSSEPQIPTIMMVSVQQAPRPIKKFINGYTLNIRRFNYKEHGPPVIFRSFPDISGLTELKLVNLNIQNLSNGIGHFEFLEKLDLSGNDFENLPEDMYRFSKLKTLWLRNCSKLKGLPDLPQVKSLTLSNCKNLISLVKLSDASQEPERYCLLDLGLDNCKNVKPLSEQLSHFTGLTCLDLSSHDFESLPSSISDLTSLVFLSLNNCMKLKSLEKLPKSLKFLDAKGCDSLEADAIESFRTRLNKRGTGTTS